MQRIRAVEFVKINLSLLSNATIMIECLESFIGFNVTQIGLLLDVLDL